MSSKEVGKKTPGGFFADSGADTAEWTSALYVRANSAGTGDVSGLRMEASGEGKGFKEGISCVTTGGGPKRAGNFYAATPPDWDDATQGLSVTAISNGTGNTLGFSLDTGGSGPGQKEGIVCTVQGSGHKYAGQFRAYSSGTADGSEALLAVARSEGTGGALGLYIDASGSGPGRTQGIHLQVEGGGTNEVNGLTISSKGDGTGWKTGITCEVSGAAGPIRGSHFSATGTAASTDEIRGMGSYATSAGSGDTHGIVAFAGGSGTGTKYGLYSYVTGNGTCWAGYFGGNVHVSGTLSKAGGTFLIDHPLDPENKTLRHSFVESPEDLCLYRGKVQLDAAGKGSVKMPSYFAALTREEDATVSLTAIGSKPFLTGYEWNRNFTAFTVYGEPSREVSYLVLADRDDPVVHQLRRPVEEKKGAGYFQKGELLNPEAYGKAPKAAPDGVGAARQTTVPMDRTPSTFPDLPAPPTPTAPPDFPSSPLPTAPFPAREEEHRRIEEAWARSREEQRQRMESFQHDEQQRRRQLEEALAARRQQPDQTPQERGGPIETLDDAPETPSAPPESAPPRRKKTIADRKKK